MMKLYEHESADLFAGAGIRVPERILAATPDDAVLAAEKIGFPVVVKAQVLTGSRGLSGGIKIVSSAEQTHSAAVEILGTKIQGIKVRAVMIVRKIDFHKELYLGITLDGYIGKPVIMASSRGGVRIEEAAEKNPADIASLAVDMDRGLYPYEARKLLKKADFPAKQIPAAADILVRLYDVFLDCCALTAEINPLVVCVNESLMALDAKMEIDDASLFRVGNRIPKGHERNESRLEKMGREIGVTYVDLDGDIGIISSGAGLGMATMDIIGRRLQPANFLETCGGITEDLLYRTMELIMMKKGLRAVFINLYGGINPIHEGAKGIVRFVREHGVSIPIVAKALGNRQEETWEILRSGGVHVVTEIATEQAVDRLLEILGKQV